MFGLFGYAYGNNLCHVHKLFSAYFHKLSMIAYEKAYSLYVNSFTLFYIYNRFCMDKQLN